jgi:hypothetical protein
MIMMHIEGRCCESDCCSGANRCKEQEQSKTHDGCWKGRKEKFLVAVASVIIQQPHSRIIITAATSRTWHQLQQRLIRSMSLPTRVWRAFAAATKNSENLKSKHAQTSSLEYQQTFKMSKDFYDFIMSQ